MTADRLSNWDAVDLARILADRFADSEDLLEAFPAVGEADSFASDALPEFIEKNWGVGILARRKGIRGGMGKVMEPAGGGSIRI